MSASKDKLIRRQQIEAGTDKRTIAAAEEAKKRRRNNITYAVVAALLVVFFAFIFIYNSSLPSRHTTAVTIDGENYSVAQTNYYYSTSYLTFYNNYAMYINYGMFFDPSTSLAEQEYAEGVSWRQHFLDEAVDTMTEVQVLNKAAAEEGYELSEEQQANYESNLESIRSDWGDYGYSSLKQYLNLNYGTAVDMDIVEEELYRTYVASTYSQSVYDSYEYSADELAAYYSEHADELDVITYAYYTDFDGSVDTQAAAEALAGTSAEEFAAYMEENYEDAAPTTLSYSGSSLPEAYAEWLLDPARAPGDTAAIEEDDASTTVVMFLERDVNDYHPVAFRHILISAEDTDGDGVYSDEEIAAAEAQAQEIFDEWQAGDATEDSFAELANTYSTDTGSNTNGGLYETVTEGEMVEVINDWLFEDGRKAGDTTIVTNNGGYTGAHIVYFVGEEDATYADTLSDTALRDADFSAWLEELKAGCEVTTNHLSMCGKNH